MASLDGYSDRTGSRTFLDHLLTKRAAVEDLRRHGLNPAAAIREVDRQIREACHGCIITGQGVTKSGTED